MTNEPREASWSASPLALWDGRTWGAHTPSRVVSSAVAGNIGTGGNGFDEDVEPDSRGRLCSPFRIQQGQRVAPARRTMLGDDGNLMQADGNSFPVFILGWTIGAIGG
jgi:hypothetical protein